jgi:hypothetical protein
MDGDATLANGMLIRQILYILPHYTVSPRMN